MPTILHFLEEAEKLDFTKMNDHELAKLEYINSAILGELRRAGMNKSGWKWEEGWDRKGPGVKNVDGFPDPDYDRYDLDHIYQLTSPKKDIIYVSEPYISGSSGESITRSAASAKEDGFDMRIRPASTLHFPGHTLALWFTRIV